MILKALFYLIFGALQVPVLLDAIVYPGASVAKLGISPTAAVIASTLLVGLAFISKRPHFSSREHHAFKFFAGVLIVAQLYFSFVVHSQYANAVFNTFHIHYINWLLFVWNIFTLSLLERPRDFYRYRAVHFTHLALLIIAVTASLYTKDKLHLYEYFQDGKDDTIAEQIQLLFFAASTFLSGSISLYFYKKKNVFLSVLFGIATCALFLITGEEISWGQRIFNIQTPEYMAQKNLQNETNFHNLDGVFGLVYRTYVLVNALAFSTWIIFDSLMLIFKKTVASSKYKKQLLDLRSWVIPGPSVSIFFFVSGMVFYLQRIRSVDWLLQPFEEFAELMLAAGILCFFIEKYLQLQQHKHASK